MSGRQENLFNFDYQLWIAYPKEKLRFFIKNFFNAKFNFQK